MKHLLMYADQNRTVENKVRVVWRWWVLFSVIVWHGGMAAEDWNGSVFKSLCGSRSLGDAGKGEDGTGLPWTHATIFGPLLGPSCCPSYWFALGGDALLHWFALGGDALSHWFAVGGDALSH
eukprot:354449-Chlamydomonas_euryale.AAC.1